MLGDAGAKQRLPPTVFRPRVPGYSGQGMADHLGVEFVGEGVPELCSVVEKAGN